MKIQFYYVDSSYIAFLKEVEQQNRNFTCVPNVEYAHKRKFLYGSVMEIEGMHYFVPVSSKIEKNSEHNLLIKTDDKRNPKKGSLRFPYMIPIPLQCLRKLVIDEISDPNEKARISKELKFCRKNRDKIVRMAQNTYLVVMLGKNDRLLRNSCDFKLLEQACLAYCRQHGYEIPCSTQATERKYFYFELTQRQLDALKNKEIPCEYTQKDTRLIVRVPKEFEEQARMVISGIAAGLK